MRFLLSVFLTAFIFSLGYAKERISNEMIYLKLLEIEKRQAVLEAEFKQFRDDTNKRFEELREDMSKRFEQIDKRFEQVDKRFEQIIKFLKIIVGVFASLVAVVIGFAYWDRRTIVKKAKEEAIEEIEKEGKLKDLIKALRELSKKDPELAKLLKEYNLL